MNEWVKERVWSEGVEWVSELVKGREERVVWFEMVEWMSE